MCALSADLNFRLPARPTLPPIPPFGNAQECLCLLLFLRLTSLGLNHEWLSHLIFFPSLLLFTSFFNCFFLPLKAHSYAHTLVKCTAVFMSISCFAAVNKFTDTETWRALQRRQDVRRTYSPKCGCTTVAFTYSDMSVSLYKKSVWIIHRPNTQSSTDSIHVAVLWLRPGLTWVSQRTSQRLVTSGWRYSTCDLCCWPPACFLIFVHIQPLNSYNPDCPTAMYTDFSKRITTWTNSVCHEVGQYDKYIRRRKKCVNHTVYTNNYPFIFFLFPIYLVLFLHSMKTLW